MRCVKEHNGWHLIPENDDEVKCLGRIEEFVCEDDGFVARGASLFVESNPILKCALCCTTHRANDPCPKPKVRDECVNCPGKEATLAGLCDECQEDV